MNREYLYRGKSEDNGEWVYGNHLYDEISDKHFIVPFGNIEESQKVGENGCCYCVGFEVIPETIGKCSGRCDISGKPMYEGDVFESHQGSKILAVTMILKYGTYQAYCPADKTFMDSVGFYVEAKGYPNMPMGDTESYAKVIGNIHDNPELLEG